MRYSWWSFQGAKRLFTHGASPTVLCGEIGPNECKKLFPRKKVYFRLRNRNYEWEFRINIPIKFHYCNLFTISVHGKYFFLVLSTNEIILIIPILFDRYDETEVSQLTTRATKCKCQKWIIFLWCSPTLFRFVWIEISAFVEFRFCINNNKRNSTKLFFGRSTTRCDDVRFAPSSLLTKKSKNTFAHSQNEISIRQNDKWLVNYS